MIYAQNGRFSVEKLPLDVSSIDLRNEALKKARKELDIRTKNGKYPKIINPKLVWIDPWQL
jgi:hypothetical protein